jgi:3-dehydroquinate synthase
VVGDLAGFVAATYLRGLPLVQVPTSLVAQVDSSLGGKVGVDLSAGKNLVGAFYPPRIILLDSQLLATLPEDEWNSGMAEVLKHALIDSQDHWESLESLPATLNPQQRQALVSRSRQVKRSIIEQDPFEKGIRAYLNLGHTLAHAIESAQNYQGWNHGQAVGFGLRAALRLSHDKLGLSGSWEQRLQVQLERYQLPTQSPPMDFSSLIPYLLRDKKNQHGKLRFVLLRQPGQAELCDQVTLDDLKKIWEELQCER